MIIWTQGLSHPWYVLSHLSHIPSPLKSIWFYLFPSSRLILLKITGNFNIWLAKLIFFLLLLILRIRFIGLEREFRRSKYILTCRRPTFDFQHCMVHWILLGETPEHRSECHLRAPPGIAIIQNLPALIQTVLFYFYIYILIVHININIYSAVVGSVCLI